MLKDLKRKPILFLSIFAAIMSLSLVSCNTSTEEVDNEPDTTTNPDEEGTSGEDSEEEIVISENEDLTIPEQTEVTQIYLKRALTGLVVGQTIDLTNYIGILPGTTEDPDATTFIASILTVTGSDDCASISGTRLSLHRVGTFYLAIEANTGYRVFTLEVEASSTLNTLTSFLGNIEDNYTAEFIAQDDLGAEYVSSSTYRDGKYIYNTSSESGYVVAGDSNVYTFSLSSVDSDDLEIDIPPVGESLDYYNLFYDLNTLSQDSYWIYGESFSDEAQYSSYNYILDSSTYASRFCADMFLSTSTSYNGYTVYPYRIYARVTTNEIRFIPIYANSSLTLMVYYTTPIRLTNIGTTSVTALKAYVDNQEYPEKVDASEIITNFQYLSDIKNYTRFTEMTVYDEDGDRLLTNSSARVNYFIRIYYNLSYRAIMPNAYWSSNYSGSNGTKIPGGLINYNNKTYLYRNYNSTPTDYNSNIEDYVLYSEYIESGKTESYDTWYAYENMSGYIFSNSFSISNFYNSYPELTEDGDYYFDGSLESGEDIVEGALAIGVQPYSATSGTLHSLLSSSSASSCLIHFDYSESDGSLSGLTFTTTLTIDADSVSSSYVSEDYTLEFVTEFTNIGTTDFSALVEHIESQIE